MIDGPTKQLIANIRSEFRNVLNRVEASNDELNQDLVNRIQKFNEYLISIDEPVEHPDVLGISIGEKQRVIDKFGG